jgi:hypothetical protein
MRRSLLTLALAGTFVGAVAAPAAADDPEASCAASAQGATLDGRKLGQATSFGARNPGPGFNNHGEGVAVAAQNQCRNMTPPQGAGPLP